MFLFRVPSEEIQAVLDYPFPPGTYPFNAEALRATIALSYALTLTEKLAMVDAFPTYTADYAARVTDIFVRERRDMQTIDALAYEGIGGAIN